MPICRVDRQKFSPKNPTPEGQGFERRRDLYRSISFDRRADARVRNHHDFFARQQPYCTKPNPGYPNLSPTAVAVFLRRHLPRTFSRPVLVPNLYPSYPSSGDGNSPGAGSTEDGPGEAGVAEESGGSDGPGEDGAGDSGSGEDGAGEDGAGDEGCGDGSGEDGPGEDGSGDEGVGDTGSGEDGAGAGDSPDAGLGDEGAGGTSFASCPASGAVLGAGSGEAAFVSEPEPP